jgi:hypoxanthine phosphoribosyltransferase
MSNIPPDQIMNHAERIYTAADIDVALNTMAEKITHDYAGRNPLCIVVLNGGLVFAGQLLPKLNFPLELDYLHATRYRDVLILDDILDAGVTLAEIMKFCIAHDASSVKSAVLINKDVEKHPDGVRVPDYFALSAPDRYLFGYGMDYKESWRNADGIYALL